MIRDTKVGLYYVFAVSAINTTNRKQTFKVMVTAPTELVTRVVVDAYNRVDWYAWLQPLVVPKGRSVVATMTGRGSVEILGKVK